MLVLFNNYTYNYYNNNYTYTYMSTKRIVNQHNQLVLLYLWDFN